MNRTSIGWTDFTWNPIRARRRDIHATGTFCTRISPGCKNCYASVINKRFGTGLEFEVPNLAQHEFYIDEKILVEPLKRKKPATIFVGDMFDLFHEAIPDELITRVYAVMGLCGHVFQVLTKRAERLRTFTENLSRGISAVEAVAREIGYTFKFTGIDGKTYSTLPFPFPNVWAGVSVESQKYADERIPHLLQTPAAVRFLSVEPMLEAVDLGKFLFADPERPNWARLNHLHWCICGGESGHGARPFDPAWAEKLWAQCKAADVPFFMKQDSGRFPGKQGRLPDHIWNTKQFPEGKLREQPGTCPAHKSV